MSLSTQSRFIVSDWPQGSQEWLQVRAGKATGSKADCILAKIKTGEAAARRNYRVQLVTEMLTGSPAAQGFTNDAMKWGTENEPLARIAYEAETGELVQESGFTYLHDMPVGCSVDGFIDGDRLGIVEYKCPLSATHIEYLLGGKLPSAYEPQVLHNMWVTGAAYCDFASFDPRLPEHLQLFIVRVDRDEEKMKAYESELIAFLVEVAQLHDKLSKRAA